MYFYKKHTLLSFRLITDDPIRSNSIYKDILSMAMRIYFLQVLSFF